MLLAISRCDDMLYMLLVLASCIRNSVVYLAPLSQAFLLFFFFIFLEPPPSYVVLRLLSFLVLFSLLPCPSWVPVRHLLLRVCEWSQGLILSFLASFAKVKRVAMRLREGIPLFKLAGTSATIAPTLLLGALPTCLCM